jgi:uncharacterized protein (TIGR03437 family)
MSLQSGIRFKKLGLAIVLAILPNAWAQFVQQGAKLVGAANSVALSADGNTAIVGGLADSAFGGASVYTRLGGVWSQQGGQLINREVGSANQGSVALSADGNTAIVGGAISTAYTGAAWVYTRSGAVWSQQGSELVGAGAVGRSTEGYSVALSADGNTAILGWSIDNNGAGAAWVYTRSGAVWSQQGSKLVGTGAVGGAFQGISVALSADGNTAIVGGLADDVHTGAAWVYTRSGGTWTQERSKLVGADGTYQDGFQGCSVALSADGNTAIVGGYADNGGAGAAWVYTRSGGEWFQQDAKLVGTGAVGGAQQGYSVALSADGSTAIVGGINDNNKAGAAWVYTRSGGEWFQQGAKLVGTGAVGSLFQGNSVALSADGSTAIVGDSGDSNVGAVWVFVNPFISTGPSIAPGGVINGASFLSGIAQGTWTTILGTNLSATTRTWNGSDFSGNKLPTQLDGASVTINGKAAYVYYISPTQLNVLSPEDTTQGPVAVQVTTAKGRSNIVDAVEAALSPALFTFSPQGGKYVAAVRSDGAYIGPANLIPGLATVPAKPGDTILLFGTGFGPTTPATSIGQLVNPAPLSNQVTVRVGGAVANTTFAGIVSSGEYQFNVVVPNVPNGDNAVLVGIGGGSSQTNVFLAIQQ